MKSLKQSRIDRLARRQKRIRRAVEKEAELTPKQRYERDRKRGQSFAKKLIRSLKRGKNEKCLHGVEYSGAYCFACNPDTIASHIRDQWSPLDTYHLEVVPVDSSGMYIPVTVKTRHLTQTVKEMQENGFWYKIYKEPTFLMPQSIRCILVKGMAQSRGHSDPPVKPSPKVSERIRSSQI